MTKSDLDAMMASVAEVVREYVEKTVGALPTGKDGAPGSPGKDADPEFVRSLVDAAVAAIPTPKDGAPGKDGADGRDGKDADPGPIAAKLEADLLANVERLKSELDAVVAALPPAKDGAPGKDGLNGKDGADGRHGKDGTPGRDAFEVDVLPSIDPAKSYPRGTWAHYCGGTIRAFRATDAIGEAGLEAAGWAVAMNGVADEVEEILGEGRTIKRRTVYTSGRVVEREHHTALILFREYWKAGEYRRGDVVQWDGGIWYCKAETATEKPGTAEEWRLMVKRGRDGRDRGADGSLQTTPVVKTR